MGLEASAAVAERALERMQAILRAHIPGIAFGEQRVRYNPWEDRYHAIVLVKMPPSVPRDRYDEVMSAHMPDYERDHLAVLVGRLED